jgi:hypothetical protein
VRLKGVIAVVLVVTMTSLCSGCFAPVRPAIREGEFDTMSQQLSIGDGVTILLVVAGMAVALTILFAITLTERSSAPKFDTRDLSGFCEFHTLVYAVCDHWEKCGKWDKKGCILYHSSVMQSRECLEKQLKAGCEEYNSKQAEYRDICWPPCEPGPEKCEGSWRLICDDGGLVVIDCAKWCGRRGMDYSGKCIETTTGKARCECR